MYVRGLFFLNVLFVTYEMQKRQAKQKKDKSLGYIFKKMEEKGPLLLNELRASKAAKEMEIEDDEEEEEVYKVNYL